LGTGEGRCTVVEKGRNAGREQGREDVLQLKKGGMLEGNRGGRMYCS